MILTTTNIIEGKPATAYLGIVTSEVIIGANFMKDFLGGLRDFFGGRSGTYESVLKEAKESALAELRQNAQAMGADFGYIGSAFIATTEARASDAYKQAIVDSNSDDIIYSNLFTGVHGNYLAPSIRAAGMDPDNLPVSDPSKMNFGGDKTKAWKDIWGCGQGIGTIDKVQSTADFVAQLRREYESAKARLM